MGEYDRVSNLDRLKLTPDLTTRWATGNDNFVYLSLWDFKSSFTCRKTYDMGRAGQLYSTFISTMSKILKLYACL
jgi:hypothetical protein